MLLPLLGGDYHIIHIRLDILPSMGANTLSISLWYVALAFLSLKVITL